MNPSISQTHEQQRRFPLPIMLILLCALVIRSGYVLIHPRPVFSDEREHHLLAKGLDETKAYTMEGRPTAFRPPGYPFALAAVYFVTRSNPLFPRIVQGLLDTLTVLLLYYLAKPYGERKALTASALWAIYPPAILYTNLLLSETFYVFLVVASSFCLVKSKGGNHRWLAVSGILLGVAILTKPVTVLFVLLLLIFSLPRLSLRFVHYASFGIAMIAVVAPWVIRNNLVFDRFMISSNTGINLFIGNNPATTGGYRATTAPEIVASLADETKLDGVSAELAARYIVAQPHLVVVNAFKKMAYFARTESELLVWSFHPTPSGSSTRFASKYASLPLAIVLLVNGTYVLLTLAGIAGFFVSGKDDLWHYFVLFLISLVIVHSVFFGGSRFHFPLMPFLAIFASLLAGESLFPLRTMKTFPKFALVTILVGLVALWTAEMALVYAT